MWLEKPFLASQIPKRSYIRKCEGKPELVFIPHLTKGKPPIFHAKPAAVPVIGSLGRGILQKTLIGIEPNIGRCAHSALIGSAVAQQYAELIKKLRISGSLPGKPQEGISPTNCEWA
jgi:hypothetical protein